MAMKCTPRDWDQMFGNFLFLLGEPGHDKINKMNVHPAKTQISLGIPLLLHADSEVSDQTGQMPRLI